MKVILVSFSKSRQIRRCSKFGTWTHYFFFSHVMYFTHCLPMIRKPVINRSWQNNLWYYIFSTAWQKWSIMANLLMYFLFSSFSLIGHGQCNCGKCSCKEGWTGKKCEHPLSCPLSLESSMKKCHGTSNLPCFGRGMWSPLPILLPWLPQQGYNIFSPLGAK